MFQPRLPRVLGPAALFAILASAGAGQSLSTPKLTSKAGAGPVSGRSLPVPAVGRRPPNVLVILCDQFNARMLGHEDNGYGGVATSLTPNLDQLAAEGVRFSNATCSAAVCQASRYSILTGRWPHHHGLRQNSIWEPRTETTFPELALAAGYYTGNIGKHHLIWPNQPRPYKDLHGFLEFIDQGDYQAFCIANGVLAYDAPTNFWAMPGVPAVGGFEETGYTFNTNEFHPSGYWAQEMIRFLEDRAGPDGDGKPFVCWYSMVGPHPPILPSGVAPDDWAHLYQPYTGLQLPPNYGKVATTQRLALLQTNFAPLTPDESREALSYYYGAISQIDYNIGRVLDTLEQLDLADDTLVVFTADHGEMASEMRCWTKGAGSYDALTRVPFLWRLPGVLPAGKTVSAPACNIDIFPTLVEVTGMPIDDPLRETIDGVSLLDLMVDDVPPAGWRQETFHELGTTLTPAGRQFMVRTPTMKYASDELDGSQEFYDLASDPFEITDRFGDPDPGIQAEIADLQQRFDAWWNNGIGHAPQYAPIGGQGTALPVPPADPTPADTAVGVARDVDPTWVPCTGAFTQDVYFGTNAGNLSLFATLPHMTAAFNPGSLGSLTTYFWRVDQVNKNGTATGPVWSFTTAAGGSGGPGLAAGPLPAHKATGVPAGAGLTWTVGAGTVTQDVRFGRAGALQLVESGYPASLHAWDPPALEAGATYEWRIDEVNAQGTTVGDRWTFEVDPAGLPGRALTLAPAHLQAGVTQAPVLRWSAGAGAAAHEVFFGTSFPLAYRGTVQATWWDPGPLALDQVYYWRIDEVNAAGRTTGWTARFTR